MKGAFPLDLFRFVIATPLRIEAAKARLKLGEAKLITVGDGDHILQAIHDKDALVFLDEVITDSNDQER